MSSEQAIINEAGSAARFSRKSVDIDGIGLRYREAGAGAPLVCLHGGGGLRLSRAHGILAEHHRVIALAIPGFGETPADPRLATLADFATLLNRAVAALGLERYSLMGHGLGAGLALAMALARPDPVDAIVLIAPVAIRPTRPAGGKVGSDMLYVHPERHGAAEPLPASVAALQAETASLLFRAFEDEAFEAGLKALQVPVLSLFGTVDQVTPTDLARLYRTALPSSYIAMVYDAAHAIDAERPEAVASIAADFLARRERFIVSSDIGLINP